MGPCTGTCVIRCNALTGNFCKSLHMCTSFARVCTCAHMLHPVSAQTSQKRAGLTGPSLSPAFFVVARETLMTLFDICLPVISVKARSLSASSAKRTKPKPLERPLVGSVITCRCKRGVKPSPTRICEFFPLWAGMQALAFAHANTGRALLPWHCELKSSTPGSSPGECSQ
jgi:hypothetical protein